jgi:O-ureido-D-serine cyclo-ligase
VAVSAAYPDLRPDWPLLRSALHDLGIAATTSVWTDPNVEWDTFDLVVANGAWDNIHRPVEFLSWVDGVAARTAVVNSPATLTWNMDKRYLVALAAAGVPTVPTVWLEATDATDQPLALPWPESEIVVKPTISGGGFETARYQPHEAEIARGHIGRLLSAGRTVMLQPYLASVDLHGEVGLIFLGGQFSHPIGKGPLLRPSAGATTSLVGTEVISTVTPSYTQIQTAHDALSAAEGILGPTSYARVDVVALGDGTSAVLELELLDPALFLEFETTAALRFARVLQAQMRSGD